MSPRGKAGQRDGSFVSMPSMPPRSRRSLSLDIEGSHSVPARRTSNSDSPTRKLPREASQVRRTSKDSPRKSPREANDTLLEQEGNYYAQLGEADRLVDVDVSPSSGSYFRSRAFKVWVCVVVAQIAFAIVGVLILLYAPYAITQEVQLWRWFFLVALLPVAWVLAQVLTRLEVWMVEKTMMSVPYALYYAYSCRHQIRWINRSALILVTWACMMRIATSAQSSGLNQAYDIITRLLGCVVLLCTANLIKRVLALMMAVGYYDTSHYDTMRDALRKEHFLKALLRPRPAGKVPVKVSNSSVESSLESGESNSNRDRDRDRSHHQKDRVSPAVKLLTPLGVAVAVGKGRENEIDVVVVAVPGADTEASVDADVVEASRAATPNVVDFRAQPIPQSTLDLEEADAQTRTKIINQMVLIEQHLRKKKIIVTFQDNQEKGRLTACELKDELTRKRVAYYLFINLKGEDEFASHVTADNMRDFLYDEEVEGPKGAFELFDADKDGRISVVDCMKTLDAIELERRNLADTLRDTKSINATLEVLIGVMVHVLFIYFYLWIFDDVTSHSMQESWLGLTGVILSFSFLFSGAAQNAFENILFLYGTRSFSIGDMLHMHDLAHVVKEISINFTKFETRGRTAWIPNKELRNTSFINLSRSPYLQEVMYVLIDADADPSILEDIRQGLADLHKEHPQEYLPNFRSKFDKTVAPFKLRICVLFTYSHSGTNLSRTAMYRSKVIEMISAVMARRNISYSIPPVRKDDADGDAVPGAPKAPKPRRDGERDGGGDNAVDETLAVISHDDGDEGFDADWGE